MNDTQHLKREKEIDGKSQRTSEKREDKTNYPVSRISKKRKKDFGRKGQEIHTEVKKES